MARPSLHTVPAFFSTKMILVCPDLSHSNSHNGELFSVSGYPTQAYVALLKPHCEDFSTHGTYPIRNTVDPFARIFSQQSVRCARATTTHVLTD
jgi:hypothetical protein